MRLQYAYLHLTILNFVALLNNWNRSLYFCEIFLYIPMKSIVSTDQYDAKCFDAKQRKHWSSSVVALLTQKANKLMSLGVTGQAARGG